MDKHSSLLVISAFFLVVLIVYGGWQDTHIEVRYTDVVYLVFSDAASLMAHRDSPYKRTTYRRIRHCLHFCSFLIPSFIDHGGGSFSRPQICLLPFLSITS